MRRQGASLPGRAPASALESLSLRANRIGPNGAAAIGGELLGKEGDHGHHGDGHSKAH